MRRTLTPILTTATLLMLAGCGSQPADTTPAEDPAAADTTATENATENAGDFPGAQCTPDRESEVIDANDEKYWGEDAEAMTPCLGDTIQFANGITVTPSVPRAATLNEEGHVIMTDEEIPGAEVLAIDVTIKNDTDSVLDMDGWDAPVMPESYLIWSVDDESYEGQRAGNLGTEHPGEEFPSRILPGTSATEAYLYKMPGPADNRLVFYTLSVDSLATTEDYDNFGTEAAWMGIVPDDITLADENPDPVG